MGTPIAITFDTSTYSTIADLKISWLLEKWWPLDRDGTSRQTTMASSTVAMSAFVDRI